MLQTLSNQALLLVVHHGFCHRHMAPPSAPHGRLRTSQASSGDIDDIRPDLRAFSPIGGMSLVATAHQIAVLRPILSLPQVLPSGCEYHPSVLSDDWLLRAFLVCAGSIMLFDWPPRSEGLAGKILFGGSEASCPVYVFCIPAYIFFSFPQAVRFKKLGAQSFVFLGGAPVSALGERRRASVRCHLWADSSVSHPDGGKVGGNSFDLISCCPSRSGYLSQIQGSSSFHGDHYESSWK